MGRNVGKCVVVWGEVGGGDEKCEERCGEKCVGLWGK